MKAGLWGLLHKEKGACQSKCGKSRGNGLNEVKRHGNSNVEQVRGRRRRKRMSSPYRNQSERNEKQKIKIRKCKAQEKSKFENIKPFLSRGETKKKRKQVCTAKLSRKPSQT